MTTKTFEIRDRATTIPILAIRLDPVDERDRWLLMRSGFGETPEAQRLYVVLVQIAGGVGRATSDPYGWASGARTLPVAHNHIIMHFDDLANGAVVDVEFLLGETPEPKRSEAEAYA